MERETMRLLTQLERPGWEVPIRSSLAHTKTVIIACMNLTKNISIESLSLALELNAEKANEIRNLLKEKS